MASSECNAFVHSEGRRDAEPPLPAPLPRRRRGPAGSPLSNASPGDFRIGSPLQVVDSGASGCCLQCVHLPARTVWPVVHMHPGRSRVRRGRLTDRAGQIDPCGAALLSLQDHRVLSVYCQHAAWERSRLLLCVTGANMHVRRCRLNQVNPVVNSDTVQYKLNDY